MSSPSASEPFKFCPEQNPRPAPVRIRARTSSSSVISAIAAASAPSRSGVIAFRLAGSSSVKIPTAPSRACFTPAMSRLPLDVLVGGNVPFFVHSANCGAATSAQRSQNKHKTSTSDIMPHQFSLNQTVRKPAVTSKGGIVASQSRRAAEVGAEVLAAGGDCVAAIVATTFALNELEPWNSGIGGGGAMVLYRAKENRYEVIDYGMCAPQGLRVADYPLSGEGAVAKD